MDLCTSLHATIEIMRMRTYLLPLVVIAMLLELSRHRPMSVD